MAIQVPWMSIEIGYQAVMLDAAQCKLGSPKPKALESLEAMFLKKDLARFESGSVTLLPITLDDFNAGDDWAAMALDYEINKALLAAGGQATAVIRMKEDLRRITDKAPGARSGTLTAMAKDKDTRCVLRGTTWVSQRTYRVSTSVGGKYSAWKPKQVVSGIPEFLATLVWRCHPVTHAL